MTLGNRIQQLRKEHNMSQGDLADALDISRQSVSKWETDTATPDLDKLLKLSEIFDITLDELVKGQSPSPNEPQANITAPEIQPVPVTIKTGLETRQIAGIILLSMAALIVVVCTIMGGFLAGLIYCIPFLLCGLICMFVKKHTGTYCGWAIVILLELLTRFAMSVHWSLVFQPWIYIESYPLHAALCWAHLAVVLFVMGITIYSFRTFTPNFDSKTNRLLLCCFGIYLVLHFPFGSYLLSNKIIQSTIHGNWWIIGLLNVITTLGRQFLFTALIIYVLAWRRQKKTK